VARKTFLYTVHTRCGITFQVEAANLEQAQTRARAPVIARTVSGLIRAALTDIERVEPHRGPAYAGGGHLVFRDENF
jgi:hypothetical protein